MVLAFAEIGSTRIEINCLTVLDYRYFQLFDELGEGFILFSSREQRINPTSLKLANETVLRD